MDIKHLALEIFAVAVSYLLLMLPVTSATSVNIFFNGIQQDTTDISPGNLVSKEINVYHDADDITWTNIKVLVTLSSASLSHSIKKIYLYKCKTLSPSACIQGTPQVFDSWIDTELSWNDISQSEGVGVYPQTANLMFLVKLEDFNGKASWVGFWDTIRRIDYNIFNHYSYPLNEIEFHAKSLDMIEPIKTYIENYQMIPFNWAEKVVFRMANILYGVGANEQEIEQTPPFFDGAQTSTNQVTSIGKDYYFVLSNITSGITNPVTMRLNPSFTCGNGQCETDLGETTSTCCYDCGCAADFYCDMSDEQNPETGACRSLTEITVDVTSTSMADITDCSQNQQLTITAQINNAPSNLPATLTGYIKLNETQYNVPCQSSIPGIYECTVNLQPEVRCGDGSYVLGPNEINFTIPFNDGPDMITETIGTEFSDITVNYNCECAGGYYCDSGLRMCKPEGQIALVIINVTSYMDNYNPAGDNIGIYATINNPPSDMSITGSSYVLGNITFDGSSSPGSSGSVTCDESNNIYYCSIPLFIQNYDHSRQYIVNGNSLSFTISFSDGGNSITKTLTTGFSDIIVPSYRCGDTTCNAEENSDNCCLDCGCPNPDDYCDRVYGCVNENNITMVIDTITPENLTDCKIPHVLNIKARILNAPSDLVLNYYYYLQNDEIKGWNLLCMESPPGSNMGIFECQLAVPPIDDCSLPYYTLGNNKLRFSVSFPNGLTQVLTKTLEAEFQDINIVPTYHCGDNICEYDLNESGSVCCIDCICGSDPDFGSEYYCDYDPQLNPNGTCLPKNNITLVIDKPMAVVHFTSCEKANTVNIKAHVENQPSGMIVENIFGIFNGETAEYISCTPEMGIITTPNYTGPVEWNSYNCSLIVPAEQQCSQGQTYTYSNNSLSFFISYTNGLGKRETQILTQPYPDVTITQNIRTLYDIMQDAISRMKGKLQETITLMEDLIKMWEDCLDMLIALTIVMVIGTIVAGVIGAKTGGTEGFSETVKASSAASTAVITTLMGICEIMGKVIQLRINMKETEIDFIRMETCIEVYQHQMDTGMCDRNAEGCFNAIAGCIEFGEINSFINSAQSIGRDINSQVQRIGNAWRNVGETVEGLSFGAQGEGAISFTCSPGGSYCCGYVPRTTTGAGQNQYQLQTVSLTMASLKNCERPSIKIYSKKDWLASSDVCKSASGRADDEAETAANQICIEAGTGCNVDRKTISRHDRVFECKYLLKEGDNGYDENVKMQCEAKSAYANQAGKEKANKICESEGGSGCKAKATFWGENEFKCVSSETGFKEITSSYRGTTKELFGPQMFGQSDQDSGNDEYAFVLACDGVDTDTSQTVKYCLGTPQAGCGTGSPCAAVRPEWEDMAPKSPAGTITPTATPVDTPTTFSVQTDASVVSFVWLINGRELRRGRTYDDDNYGYRVLDITSDGRLIIEFTKPNRYPLESRITDDSGNIGYITEWIDVSP